MADTIWMDATNKIFYKDSGRFTSTVKDSEDVSGVFATARAVTTNADGNTPALENLRLHVFAGQFTSTILDSESTPDAEILQYGMTADYLGPIYTASDFGGSQNLRVQISGFLSTTIRWSQNFWSTESRTDGWALIERNIWLSIGSDDKLMERDTNAISTSLSVNSIDSDPKGVSWDRTDDTTIWSGNTTTKLYATSGRFTSTLRDSEDVSGRTSLPDDLDIALFTDRMGPGTSTYQDVDWVFADQATDRLFYMSGSFTSQVKDSIDISGTDLEPGGISTTGTEPSDTPWSGGAGDTHHMQSGRFTSTVKQSVVMSGIDTDIRGISLNDIDTYWTGRQADKLYNTSGQFTTTIHDSEAIGGIDTGVQGISVDDVNTLWTGDSADKIYYQSGQFTSTLKDSQLCEGTQPVGVGTDGIHTYNITDTDDKIFINSAKISGTIKDSYGLSVHGLSAKGLETGLHWARLGQLEPVEITDGVELSDAAIANTVDANTPASDGVKFSDAAQAGVNEIDAFAVDGIDLGDGPIALDLDIFAIDIVNFGETLVTEQTYAFETVITFVATATSSIRREIVSTNITFGSVAQEAAPRRESVDSSILFAQTHVKNIYHEQLTTAVTFYAQARTQFVALSASNTITFTQVLSVTGSIYDRELETAVLFDIDDPAGQTFTEAVSNSITFTVATTHLGRYMTNAVVFTATAAAIVAKDFETAITFAQAISTAGSIWNKLPTTAIVFNQTEIEQLNDIPEYEYDPQGDDLPSVSLSASGVITLYDGATTITLRAPDFGNTEEINVQRAANRLRGGDLKLHRETIWPRNRRFNIHTSELERQVAMDLLDFIQDNLGAQITFTDHEGRVWDALILNPREAVTNKGDCRYEADLELVGTLQ
jgi:hypothetical protein